MNTIDFCYWLQGHFEMSETDALSDKQVQIIKNHLNLVFKHEIDPLRDSQTTAKPGDLSSLHDYSQPNNDMLIRC